MPIPVQYILGLVLGIFLQISLEQRFISAAWIGIAIGLPLFALGIGLAVLSVLAAGDTDIESPKKLITGGPYSLSRNPMYVAWTLMYLGIGLISKSLWIIILLPIVLAFTHFFDVLREERFLEEEFGDEYLLYKRKVRRYL